MEKASFFSTQRPWFWILSSFIFFTFLALFTITKISETKITSLIQGYLQQALDPYGIYITDQGRSFSLWKGAQYQLKHPTFELSDGTKIEAQMLTLNPSWISLLKVQLGGELTLEQGPSSKLHLLLSGRGSTIHVQSSFENLNLNQLGVLQYAGGIQGNALLQGSLLLEGDLSNPQSSSGQITVNLKNIFFDEQAIMGFQLNAMKIAEGVIDLQIQNGKVILKNVRLGKPHSLDDLNAVATGDITLNRYLNSSVLNLKAIFGISENVKQKLSLLDSILGMARQADGRYAYRITGSLGAPMPMPEPSAP